MKDHSRVLKAFSKFKKRNKPRIFFDAVYVIKLSINLIFSPINLPFIKPVWSASMSFGSTRLIQLAMDLAAMLYSVFKSERGRQF